MKLIKIFAIAVCLVGVERFCHYKTEGFRMLKIASKLPYREDWATPPATEEIKTLLAQPYHFLGKGGQCYAFISADNTCVIKFFKHHHLRPLPFGIEKEKRKKLLESVFSSFKIAHDRLKEQTGLLYLHLNPTIEFQKKLTLIDPLGISHSLDLNQTTFALQRRATLAFPTLKTLVKEGNIELAKAHLSALFDLIVERSQAHVIDFDPVITRNMGFIDGKAVEFDLGSFADDPNLINPIAQKRVLFFETLQLRSWLKKNTPDLLPFFDLQLDAHFVILSQSEVAHA